MRHAWLLLALIGCRRDENPEYIQSLLDQTPIPVHRLREILEIKPGELEVLGGPPPAVLDPPAPTMWALRNKGSRPLWVNRWELIVRPSVKPLLSNGGGCGGPLYDHPLDRPDFSPAHWLLLLPGEQRPLSLSEAQGWGRATFSLSVGDQAKYLLWQAESFNAGAWTPEYPKNWVRGLACQLGSSWNLPPFFWPDDLRPLHLLRPESLGEGNLLFRADIQTSRARPQALPLDGWVLNEQRDLVFQGPLTPIAHHEGREDGVLKVRSDYKLPEALPSGEYRILVVAANAGPYLADDGPPQYVRNFGGISRWIPFSVLASSGSPGGEAPRD